MSILQEILPKLHNIAGKVVYDLNTSLYTIWNERNLHIWMSLGSQKVSVFGHLPGNPPFWKRLSSLNGRVNQKEQALEVSKCSFSERTTSYELHQPRLWFITGGYLVKRWFIPAAARARGQSNDLNREILASNLFNCHKEVINAPPVPSISRCIHTVYRHKNVWEYQWSNFIYNCMSTFLHYVRGKDALLDCSAPGGERCELVLWN